jgi:malonate transporter and related proteins
MIIIQAILPVFLLIALGVVLEFALKDKIEPPRMLVWMGCAENSWISGLNGFALYVALPALIFYSLTNTDKSQLLTQEIVWINVAILIAVILLTTLITRGLGLKKDVANAYITTVFFGQVAYLGFPFLESLIPGSTSTVSLHVAIHVGIAFTVLLGILEYQKNGKADIVQIGKQLLKNPLLISVVLGLIWLAYDLPVHTVFDSALAMLAASASPVVLVAIGMFMGRKIHVDETFWHAVMITATKIIILPVVFLLVSLLIDMPETYNVSIILAGMPVALTCFALSEIYDINRRVVANAIILSTIGAVVTLTGLSFILL